MTDARHEIQTRELVDGRRPHRVLHRFVVLHREQRRDVLVSPAVPQDQLAAGSIERGQVRALKLSYKGGSNVVTVPPNVPIVTLTPAKRSDLTPGKKVFVVTTPASQGTYVAQRVVVEKDGAVAPM
ncbi:hypothetical protein OKW45_000408 [Paraburkholderia sp. WSM4175]